MNHNDHVELLRAGVHGKGGTWADFGAGRGAFTLALADLLPDGSEIYAVDKDAGALRQLRKRMGRNYPAITLHTVHADYTSSLSLPPLDGLVMANALHYQRHKEPVVRLLRNYLRPGGRFVLVEYNTDRGNRWVPHPLSYTSWEALAGRCGLQNTILLATKPSSFLGQFFAAGSERPIKEELS